MTLLAQTVDIAPPKRFTPGVVTGTPRVLLRLEGAGMLAAASFGFGQLSGEWELFALLFLLPDLSMLGYLLGPRIGAGIYNAGHSYLSPGALATAGLALDVPILIAIALIWIAHIGFDRAVGYGFKYADAFKHTHLGTPFSRDDRAG